MIKAVIFDIDGVLVESEEFYMNRRMKFFKELNIIPGSTDINDFIGGNLDKNWEILVPNNEKLRKKLKDQYFKEFEPNNKIDFLKYSRRNLLKVFKFLKNRKIKIALASAGSVKNITAFIKSLNLEEYIEFFISGEKCLKNKPNPEIYIKSVKKLGLAKKEILVVEDSKAGIEAAKNAGLTVLAFKITKYIVDQSLADYKIADLEEIFEFI